MTTLHATPAINPKSITALSRPAPLPGSGILRPFPSEALKHIDPFVFLDTGAPLNLGSKDIHVGPHPHRGVQPISLLFRGHIEHRDSLGNHRAVNSGGMQWLIAGSGALHEEFLAGDDEGIFHMAQLWVNLPRAQKMSAPEHHALGPEDIPTTTELGSGSSARVYAGKLGGVKGPAPLSTPVILAFVQLSAGGQATIPVPPQWNAALTVVKGEISIAGESLAPGNTPVFSQEGDHIQIQADQGGEFLLMLGQPLNEPIAIAKGFVMNTQQELEDAVADYQAGRMGYLESARA